MKHILLAGLVALAMLAACDQPDTTKPAVAVVEPAAGDSLAPGLITVKAVATDDKAVTRVEFAVGNRQLGADSAAAADTFSAVWDARTDTLGGARLLKATAYDEAGNFAEAIATVYLRRPPPRDTVSPEVRLRSPRSGDTLQRDTVILKALATDNVLMARVEFFVDGSKVGEDSMGTADTFSLAWDASGATPGAAVVIKATARDTAGNTRSDSVTCRITRFTGPTFHSGDITANESWGVFAGPHIVTGVVTVKGGARLTIEPGVTVQFEAGAGLAIGNGGAGDLIAVGTTDSAIVFTSRGTIRSDTTPGFWKGIHFYGGTGSASKLSQCRITYAGEATAGAIATYGGARPTVERCEISRSAGKGIATDDQGSCVRGFSFNRVTNCVSYAMETYPDHIRFIGPGNVMTPNGQEGVYVYPGAVDSSLFWPFVGTPYVLSGDVTIGAATRPVLTIGGGASVKLMRAARMLVGDNGQPGALYAVSELIPIRFTSTSPNPSPGDWGAIVFGPDAIDAQSMLVTCAIDFGGDNTAADGMIVIRDALPEISNCSINNSLTWGIYLDGEEYPDPDVLERNNTFRGNLVGDIRRP